MVRFKISFLIQTIRDIQIDQEELKTNISTLNLIIFYSVQRYPSYLHIVIKSAQIIVIQKINKSIFNSIKMKYLTKKICFFLCLGLLIASCNKENIDEIIIDDPVFEPDTIIVNSLVNALKDNSSDGLNLDCVTINFPFELALESGNNLTIDSQSDYNNALNNQAPNRVTDFVFPLTVTENDGTTGQVTSNDILGNKFGSCIPTSGWEGLMENSETIPAFLLENNCCFSLVYPVNLEDEEGNTYVANDESELIVLLATTNELFFSLPMTVALFDGSQLDINTTQDFLDALFDCQGIAPPVTGNGFEITGFACNTIVFPFIVMTTIGPVTVNDENEYADLLLSGIGMELQYPFSLINPDGDTLVINDFDDLIASYAECGIIITVDPTNICDLPAHVNLFFNGHNIFTVFPCPFDINYPLEAIVEGVQQTITDVNSYFVITGAPSSIKETELVYPIMVTQADGTVVTLNNDDEVCSFIEGC